MYCIFYWYIVYLLWISICDCFDGRDMAPMVLNIPENEKLDVPAFLLQPKRLEYHLTVHDIPMDERPRERLRSHGPQALSSAELLAIILRTGTVRENVLELAGKLLARYGG